MLATSDKAECIMPLSAVLLLLLKIVHVAVVKCLIDTMILIHTS